MFWRFVIVIGIACAAGNVSGREPAKEITNSLGMKLLLIPKGTFTMGSPAAEKERFDNEFEHRVTIGHDYYLGVHEVTQAQYQMVLGENPSRFQGDTVEGDTSSHPVESVSWDDAVEFCRRFSARPEERSAGRVYRLPTEAEWEYACRAGNAAAFCFGDEEAGVGEHGWSAENSQHQTHPIAQKKPNRWGLYDMHGNVWEWCSDRFGDYPKGAVTDPHGAAKGIDRVVRGGCWVNLAMDCRSASRRRYAPTLRDGYFGLRLAMIAGGQSN